MTIDNREANLSSSRLSGLERFHRTKPRGKSSELAETNQSGDHGLLLEVRSLSLSKDGQLLATGSWGGKIALRLAATGEDFCEWVAHICAVSALSLCHAHSTLASASSDGTLKIWNFVDNPEETMRLTAHDGEVTMLALTNDATMVASASDDRVIHVWNTSNGSHAYSIKIPWSKTCLTFSNDGALLAIALQRSIRLWDLKNDKQVLAIQTDEAATIMAFSDDGHTLSTDSDVFKLHPNQTPAVAEHHFMANDTFHLKVSADRQWVVIGNEEVLWLPPNYRPETARLWTSSGSTVAIACGSNVLFVTAGATSSD
jgi:WD40 repeat protein